MIITITLVNTLSPDIICMCVVRTFKTYSLSNLKGYNIVGSFSYHVESYSPKTYSSYNGSLYPLNNVSPFPLPPCNHLFVVVSAFAF